MLIDKSLVKIRINVMLCSLSPQMINLFYFLNHINTKFCVLDQFRIGSLSFTIFNFGRELEIKFLAITSTSNICLFRISCHHHPRACLVKKCNYTRLNNSFLNQATLGRGYINDSAVLYLQVDD